MSDNYENVVTSGKADELDSLFPGFGDKWLTDGNGSAARIRIKLDQDTITAGSTVTGKIFLHVQHKPFSCVAVRYKVLGEERTTVTYSEGGGGGGESGSGPSTITVHDENQFLKISEYLQQFGGIVNPGLKEYTFSFLVPGTSPESYVFQDSHVDGCAVNYDMHVWLEMPGSEVRGIVKSLTVKRQAPSVVTGPLLIGPQRKNVHTMCCYKRGTVLLGASTRHNTYAAGETMYVNFAVFNSSTARVKAVEVKLIEEVYYSAKCHSQTYPRTLYAKRLNPEETVECLQQFNKLDASAFASETGAGQMQLLKDILEDRKCQVAVRIPEEVHSSFRGSLISVRHKVMIVVHTTFGTSNPTLSGNVELFRTPADCVPEETAGPPEVDIVKVSPVATLTGTSAYQAVPNSDEEVVVLPDGPLRSAGRQGEDRVVVPQVGCAEDQVQVVIVPNGETTVSLHSNHRTVAVGEEDEVVVLPDGPLRSAGRQGEDRAVVPQIGCADDQVQVVKCPDRAICTADGQGAGEATVSLHCNHRSVAVDAEDEVVVLPDSPLCTSGRQGVDKVAAIRDVELN